MLFSKSLFGLLYFLYLLKHQNPKITPGRILSSFPFFPSSLLTTWPAAPARHLGLFLLAQPTPLHCACSLSLADSGPHPSASPLVLLLPPVGHPCRAHVTRSPCHAAERTPTSPLCRIILSLTCPTSRRRAPHALYSAPSHAPHLPFLP